MSEIVGIDPGQQGGLFFVNPSRPMTGVAFDMPIFRLKRGRSTNCEIDEQALAGLLRSRQLSHAIVEQVHAMPKQGVTSAFTFGTCYGIIRGVLAGLQVPVTYVTPGVWKKVMQCPREKDGARARASQLLPQPADQWPLKRHDGRAEAALLALYGLRQLGLGNAASEQLLPVPATVTRIDGHRITRPRA